MATDPNFIRLSKGAYSLHCFHADKPNLVRDPAHKKRKMTDFLGAPFVCLCLLGFAFCCFGEQRTRSARRPTPWFLNPTFACARRPWPIRRAPRNAVIGARMGTTAASPTACALPLTACQLPLLSRADEDYGGSKRHEGSAAPGGDQEVDSITRVRAH